MAQEVSRLPELKKASAELQQQVVELQHVKQQIQRLQVRAAAAWQAKALLDYPCVMPVAVAMAQQKCAVCLLRRRHPLGTPRLPSL
jgi:hypothetical protein